MNAYLIYLAIAFNGLICLIVGFVIGCIVEGWFSKRFQTPSGKQPNTEG